MMVDRKECPMRTDLGNCMPVGGFCFNAVSDKICEAVHSAYNRGFVDCLIKHQMIEKEKEDSKDSYLMDSEFIGMGSIAIDAPKS